MIEVEARRAVREPPAFSRRHDADEKRVGAKMVSPRRGWVARALGRQKKLSPKEIRFLIYTAVALCMVAAYTTTGEEHTTRTREADKFVDHRREVGESTLVLDEPVVENVTEAFDFGDEEHVIVIDLRPEDPTHKYMDPNAKSSLKNIKEAIKNEGKKKEVVNGQFRGQQLSHMDLSFKGQKGKKPRSRGPSISEVRANPHATIGKKKPSSRHRANPASNAVYYQAKSGGSKKDETKHSFHKDGHGTG